MDCGLSTREKYPPLRGGAGGFCERGVWGVTVGGLGEGIDYSLLFAPVL